MKLFNKLFSYKQEFKNYKIHTIVRFFGIKFSFYRNLKSPNSNKFINYILNHQKDRSNFVQITKEPYKRKENDPKLVAFYLPQFHSFPENDRWFGRGFSEWSNSSKALPQYIGHYQPHLPIDLGFYNLETTDTIKRQIELAKMYGIYGFSFYYYWFSGHKVMEKPIEMFLADKSLDMPFFMFWANEPWTKLWGDGEQNEILFEHEINDGDDVKFMNDILPYMKDERYIKIDNKPLLVIYNPERYELKKLTNFIDGIRQIAKENGFSDLCIMMPRKTQFPKEKMQSTLDKYKLDAIVEFLPHNIGRQEYKPKFEKIANKNFLGEIYDVEDYVKNKKYIYKTDCKVFKGLYPNWDNTARKCYTGSWIFHSTPKLYKTWLKDIINWTKENNKKDEQFIFINAWNEWAEGAHLEPDQKYGYAYLQATKEAVKESRKNEELFI